MECPEELGQEIVEGTGKTAHRILLEETGFCPFCGEEEEE